MQPYMNLNGDSGVTAYEIGADYITVQFKSGRERNYTYTNLSAGHDRVEQLKRLARQGYGLNSYINRVVDKAYASKY